MTVACDFDVHLRIIASDGVTVLGDLNDESVGLSLQRPIGKPEGDVIWDRYTSPRSRGDFTSGAPRPAAGDLVIVAQAKGATWAEVNQRWLTVAAPAEAATPGWINAESHYFVELEEDGVVTRWHTDRPPVTPVTYDRINNRLLHQVRFHVQPNPSVSIA